jgi:hypothetical protein
MEVITKKYVTIKLQVPEKHHAVIKKVADTLECTPEKVFQNSLNHALKTGTLGHVLESMLNMKYKDIFISPRNTHDLTL